MRLLVCFLLVPSLAFAQGIATAPPGIQGGKVLASFPLSTNGTLLEDDALTVAHIYWTDTTWQDTKGVAWVSNGTVPISTVNPFTTTRYGAGPLSSTNYYSLPAGNVIDFAGDFTACFVHSPSTGSEGLVDTGNNSTTGWNAYWNGGTVTFGMPGWSGGTETTGVTGVVATGPNISCMGRNGGSMYAMSNLVAGTTRTPTAPYVPGGGTAYLGRFSTAGLSYDGVIYEAWFSATPYTAANVTAIQQRFFGHMTARGALTVARAGSSTFVPRASPATVFNAPANVLRITENGALIEPARTNYVLNNATHPKTSEATATLSTGAHVGWHDGTGTMTIAAGTATVTGLSCTTVAAGTLCPFTVTGGGTMTITTTSGTTRAQIENGATRTSFIVTAAAAASRAADVVSIAAPLLPQIPARWSISGDFKPGYGSAWGAGTLWSLGTSGAAMSAKLAHGASDLVLTVIDAASGTKTCTAAAPSFAAGSSQSLKAKDKAGSLSFLAPVCTEGGAGTGVLGGSTQTLYFGALSSTGSEFGGTIKNLTLRSESSASAHPYMTGAALGDSITAGTTPPATNPKWVDSLALATNHSIYNHAIGGSTTTWMLAKWRDTILATAPNFMTVLGGINDVSAEYEVSATTTNLQTIYEEAKAAGVTVIPITITPFRGNVGWTAERQTKVEQINAWILAYCASHGLNCVDAYTDFDEGDGTMKAAYRNADFVHLSQGGADRMAVIVAPAIP